MKKINIFKRSANITLIASAMLLACASGCKKGTFDINNTNPNSPGSVPPKFQLTSNLAETANLIFSQFAANTGGGSDYLNNWMGYWTQSGAYTPSNEYVLYQLTSGTGSSMWNTAYNNLSNYNAMLKTVGTDPLLANYRAVGIIMESFVWQRLVDEYNNVPYSSALILNAQFSYKYDKGGDIYKSIESKLDSAVTIINANTASASALGTTDVMFGGNMNLWIKFANTLKLKMLMRQTQSAANGSLGDAGVAAALSKNPATGVAYVAADFLQAGEDGLVNPGYSKAADNQENPLYLSIVANAAGSASGGQKFYRANAYAVKFYQQHNDPRDSAFYYLNANGVVLGRVYGSNNGTESNTIISAISPFGKTNGAYNGPTVSSPIIPAFESLFLQAEASQRGYLKGTGLTDPSALYKQAVEESFRITGVTNGAAAADVYLAQSGDPLVNYTAATNKIQTIITQKWAACNTFDPLESYSDYRRLGIPAIPVSIYPGVQATHIPYRFPYPTSELSYNGANVPDGGTATESLTSKIFWMP